MNLEETIHGIGETVRSVARTVKDSAVRIWNGVRARLKSLWGSLRALWEGDETFDPASNTPDDREIARRKAVAAVVRRCLGDDPIRILGEALPKQRKKLLQDLAAEICRELHLPAVAVESLDTQPGVAGYYDFEGDRVVVGLRDVIRVPMDEDDATELLDTLLHELYHRFQRYAIRDPKGMGVASAQTETWERNFSHYISSEQSPRLYWCQPVEVTARCFAHAVVKDL